MEDFFDTLGIFEEDTSSYYKIKARYSFSALKKAMPDHYDGNTMKYKMYIDDELPFDGNQATRIGTIVDDCLMKGKTITISNFKIPGGGLADYVKYVYKNHALPILFANGHREDIDLSITNFTDVFIEERDEHCTVHADMNNEKFVEKIFKTFENYWKFLIDSETKTLVSKTDFKEVMNCIKGVKNSFNNLEDYLGVEIDITENSIVPKLLDENEDFRFFRDVNIQILAKDCIYTTEREGVSRKGLIDLVRVNKVTDSIDIVDLKTGTNVVNYASTIVSRKYDSQVSWYASLILDAIHSGEFSHQPSKTIELLDYLGNTDFASHQDITCSIVALDKEIPIGMWYGISQERINENVKDVYALIEKLEECYRKDSFIDPDWKENNMVLSKREWKEYLEENTDETDLDFI